MVTNSVDVVRDIEPPAGRESPARREPPVREETVEPAHALMHRWIGVVGAVVAPTTVLTSLCYYFGYVSTKKNLAYFGVDSNAVGFASADYVLRSVSVLYAPLLVLLIGWVVALWLIDYIHRLVSTGGRPRLVQALGRTAIAVGAVIGIRGLMGVLLPRFSLVDITVLTPVAMAVGSLLVVAGYWVLATSKKEVAPRATKPAEWASLVFAGAVVMLALFWLTNIFATAYGDGRAKATALALWKKETVVVLDSSERLNAPSRLILETPLDSAPPQELSYRYECFRSLLVRGDQWVLVPARWTPQFGYALIVSDDETTRISTTRLDGLADTSAGNWTGPWQCPEVAPVPR